MQSPINSWARTLRILVIASACVLFTLLALSAPSASAGQAAGRQILYGHIPAAASRLSPVGRLPSSRRLSLAIGLPLRNQAALTTLLHQLYDPASPNFHHYLTPAQFAAQFGPTQQDYETVAAFARAHGLTVTNRYGNRVVLDVQGSVADIEKTLHVTMRLYNHPTEARTFFAPDAEPSLDLGIPLLHIGGLDNYSIPHPNLAIKPLALTRNAKPNSGSGPSGNYAGGDFRAAYAPGVTLTGAGQSVALLEFDGYYSSDITAYKNAFSLPAIPLTNVAVDGGVTTPGSGDPEVSLDIEMVMAMAPGASNIYVYEAPNPSPWDDLLSRITNDNLAKQISCSWSGGGPDSTAESLFQQMASQGQSFFNAVGDSDAFTGSIPFPSDSPHITEVGGTTLTTSGAGGTYVSETVWNWGFDSNANAYVGTSGGISTFYSIPSWQQPVSMASNQGSTSKRNVPDVALTANNIWVYYNNGSTGSFGGTSCAAPLWAAFIAMVNQQAVSRGEGTVGFINPAIYTLAQGSSYSSVLHDVTSGNNFSSSSPSKFSAVTGFDLCTGWGTPAGAALINALAPVNDNLQVSSTAAFASTGAVGGPFKPATDGYGLANNGTAQLAWTASATQGWLSLSSSGGTLAASASVTVAASINSNANALATGTYSDTITFTDTSSGNTQTQPVKLIVAAVPVITSALAATGTQGVAFSYHIAASHTPTSFTASGLPSGLVVTATSGVISGTATASGTTNVTISASNAVGTGSATLVLTVRPPLPGITSASTAGNGAAFTYNITATNSPTSFGATGLPSGLTITNSSGLISGITTATGTSNITITASNAGGSGTATLVLTVLPPGPVINSGLTATVANGAPFSYQITATNNPTSFTAAGLPSGLTVTATSGFISGSTSATGASNITLTASGVGGTGTATLLLTVLPPPPVISSSLIATATNGALFSYQIAATNNPTSFSATGLPSGLTVTVTSGVISGSTTVTGTTNITLSASSIGGTGTAALQLIVLPPPPAISSALIATATNGAPFNYQIAATNNPDSFSATGLPSGLTVTATSGIISGSTTATGTSNVTIAASNAGGSGTATLVLTVLPPPPVITGTLAASVAEGAPFNYQITATNSPTSFAASGLPSGLSIDPSAGIISGTTSVTGTSNITITASNAGGAGSAMLVLTVTSAPPVVTSSLSATGTFGDAFVYQITATNNPTSFAAGGLPSGLSVDPSSGIISGNITFQGSVNVALLVGNGVGTAKYILVITAIPAPPAITSSLSVTATEGAPFSYQITATNTPTSFAATGLPSGLSIDATQGLISGTATVSGTIGLSASNLGGTGTAALNLSVETPYAIWQSQQFLTSNLANPQISSETADPAGDGIPNLMKYALDLNPFTDGVAGLPVQSIITTGSGNYLALTFTQVNSATDITYTVQVSNDLQSWNSGPSYTSTTSVVSTPGATTQTVTVQSITPMTGSAPMQYLRLQVTGP